MNILKSILKRKRTVKAKTQSDCEPRGWNTVGTHKGINSIGAKYDAHFEDLSRNFRTM